ncbi:hypothetical protein GYMLUDRAFT_926557 [Collybiopsis luxurians FD-317 M1]|uniref:Uncharacterized protein n=1 Tax=Collybiopsis luxurians FD-317 M1 TaxID=944289 RepID=A0A0D0BG92_9AGAR|nr:hypothetical protein GYMLUDRAFT_926557 [Collybiopsis luxurians FD-317 M1]
MTPAEIELLATIGASTYHNVTSSICAFVLYGVYILSVAIAIRLIIESNTGKRKHKLIWLSVAILGAFALLMTPNFITRSMFLLVSAEKEFIQTLSQGIAAQVQAARQREYVLNQILLWPLPLVLIMSDSIAMWRAWVMWQNNNYVRGMLMLLFVGNFVTQVCDEIFDHLTLAGTLEHEPSFFTIHWDLASAVVSLAVNLSTTALIGYKAWEYRNQFRTLGLGHHKLTISQQVLLLWIESGVIFCALQILWVAFQFLDTQSTSVTVFNVIAVIVVQILFAAGGLYPIAVFIMVNLKMSMVEEITFNTANSMQANTQRVDQQGHSTGTVVESG